VKLNILNCTHLCVLHFMTFCTSYSQSDQRLDPWTVCMYVCHIKHKGKVKWVYFVIATSVLHETRHLCVTMVRRTESNKNGSS
jgi:hypothetical protein